MGVTEGLASTFDFVIIGEPTLGESLPDIGSVF
jgi:hypothetical protein